MGTNNKYPFGSKLHIRTKEVRGAKRDADKVAAAPTKAKFKGIKSAEK